MTRRTLALMTPSDRQMPFAEYIRTASVSDEGYDLHEGHWRIWKNYNKAATAGTFLELHADGRVDRVTIGPDGNVAETVNILQEL